MTKIIGLSGSMGSGKSTCVKLIEELTHKEVYVVKFAAPLYAMQELIYNTILPVYERPDSFVKDRKLLQWLGSDWGRSIDKDLWIKYWLQTVAQHNKFNSSDILICDDLRFDNEAETIKNLGGLIVKLNSKQTNLRIDTASGISNHSSEAGIKLDYIDVIIDNDGTIDDLREALLTLNQLKNIW